MQYYEMMSQDLFHINDRFYRQYVYCNNPGKLVPHTQLAVNNPTY